MTDTADKYEIALQNAVEIKQGEIGKAQRALDTLCDEMRGLRTAQNIYAKHKPGAPQLR